MSQSSTTYVSCNPETKSAACEILASLGLTMSQAFNMYLTQIVLHRGLPFDVSLPKELYTSTNPASTNRQLHFATHQKLI